MLLRSVRRAFTDGGSKEANEKDPIQRTEERLHSLQEIITITNESLKALISEHYNDSSSLLLEEIRDLQDQMNKLHDEKSFFEEKLAELKQDSIQSNDSVNGSIYVINEENSFHPRQINYARQKSDPGERNQMEFSPSSASLRSEQDVLDATLFFSTPKSNLMAPDVKARTSTSRRRLFSRSKSHDGSSQLMSFQNQQHQQLVQQKTSHKFQLYHKEFQERQNGDTQDFQAYRTPGKSPHYRQLRTSRSQNKLKSTTPEPVRSNSCTFHSINEDTSEATGNSEDEFGYTVHHSKNHRQGSFNIFSNNIDNNNNSVNNNNNNNNINENDNHVIFYDHNNIVVNGNFMNSKSNNSSGSNNNINNLKNSKNNNSSSSSNNISTFNKNASNTNNGPFMYNEDIINNSNDFKALVTDSESNKNNNSSNNNNPILNTVAQTTTISTTITTTTATTTNTITTATVTTGNESNKRSRNRLSLFNGSNTVSSKGESKPNSVYSFHSGFQPSDSAMSSNSLDCQLGLGGDYLFTAGVLPRVLSHANISPNHNLNAGSRGVSQSSSFHDLSDHPRLQNNISNGINNKRNSKSNSNLYDNADSNCNVNANNNNNSSNNNIKNIKNNKSSNDHDQDNEYDNTRKKPGVKSRSNEIPILRKNSKGKNSQRYRSASESHQGGKPLSSLFRRLSFGLLTSSSISDADSPNSNEGRRKKFSFTSGKRKNKPLFTALTTVQPNEKEENDKHVPCTRSNSLIINLNRNSSLLLNYTRTPLIENSSEELPPTKSFKEMDMDLQDEETIADWEVQENELEFLDRVGSGSFGTVYRGRWHGDCAIKKLNFSTPTEEQLESFKNEVKVLMKCRHENIILFMGASVNPPLIVTEWCSGATLYHHIHVEDYEFDLVQVLSIALQISVGIGYLHAKSIQHRDLKSPNIFLDANCTVKVGDFGLAAAKSLNKSESSSTSPVGSILWMAPEVIKAKSESRYIEESDIYSFGVVLYELLSGQLPYKNLVPAQIMFQIAMGMLKINLSEINEEAPDYLQELVEKSTHTDPTVRPKCKDISKTLKTNLQRVSRALKRSQSASILPVKNKDNEL